MAELEWLLNAAGNKVVIGFAVTIILFVIYFAGDVLFFLTGRDFRSVNVYMFHFTRNGADRTNRDTDEARGGDALEKILFLDAVPLRSLYGNRFVFWWLLIASLRTTPDKRLLKLGSHTEQIMRRICYRCARNPGAVSKRCNGFKTERHKYIAAFVYDKTPGRIAFTYSFFLFRQHDLDHAKRYFDHPPNEGQFLLFQDFCEEYHTDPNNGFGVVKITAG